MSGRTASADRRGRTAVLSTAEIVRESAKLAQAVGREGKSPERPGPLPPFLRTPVQSVPQVVRPRLDMLVDFGEHLDVNVTHEGGDGHKIDPRNDLLGGKSVPNRVGRDLET